MRKLLDAGVSVFESRGYYAARVDDIVKLANTSHGTFYLYFSNKEDLFRALAEEVGDELEALARRLPAVGPDAEGRAALRAWISEFADLYEHYGPVVKAWTEAEMGNHEFGRLGTEMLTRFTVTFTARISGSLPDRVNPSIAALALVAMLERMNYYVLSEQVKVSRSKMIDTLTNVISASLFGTVHA
jgi:AcrR family transcriptional regulator